MKRWAIWFTGLFASGTLCSTAAWGATRLEFATVASFLAGMAAFTCFRLWRAG
jgi:hypothetical protein